jgi:hypothetical protein
MKSEIIFLFSLIVSGIFIASIVASVSNNPVPGGGAGATIIVGNPSTTSTTTQGPQNITINNPMNVSFQLVARDGYGQSQNLNVTLYDDVGHDFLNNSQVPGVGYLYSPTSLADFEFTYDSNNLDVMVKGLNMTGLDGSSPQITIQSANPQISGITLYRAYKVELPSSFAFNSITLAISLNGVNGVINYNNITVYRCGNYNLVTNVCNDASGWQAQTISVDSANQRVTLNINHFSVYAVGSGSGSSQISTTTTTTSQTTVTTSTSSAAVYNPPVSNPVSSNSGGGGGGGAAIIPTITTTSTPTTTTTVLIIKKNSTTSTSASETTAMPPISGLLGLTGQFSPVLIVAIIIVASVVAIPFIKNNYSFSGINPFRKSYQTFPTRRIKKVKGKKNTELQLSL